MVAEYRKKPVIIKAIQVTLPNLKTCIKFCDGNLIAHAMSIGYLKTLEGKMLVKLGDYIIKGVQGEFYPCKPDIFELTYEKVNKSIVNGVKQDKFNIGGGGVQDNTRYEEQR